MLWNKLNILNFGRLNNIITFHNVSYLIWQTITDIALFTTVH